MVWYLYNRNLVNKGQSFTHFVLQDYQLLASIIAKEQMNLGKLVISKMSTFLSTSDVSKKNTMPYPNMVSQILGFNNIWYLLDYDKVVFPKKFGKSHLLYMKVSFTRLLGRRNKRHLKLLSPHPPNNQRKHNLYKLGLPLLLLHHLPNPPFITWFSSQFQVPWFRLLQKF